MIGIIAAMNVEMESLRSYIQNPVTETISGITFVSGTLEGSEVVTAVCGIGKVFAAMCAQTMILRYKPDCIVNTGVAGTLTDKLEIGSIAVSSAVSATAAGGVDCRIMLSVGKTAARMPWAGGDVLWLGIPLSLSGKDPFFDRNIFHD